MCSFMKREDQEAYAWEVSHRQVEEAQHIHVPAGYTFEAIPGVRATAYSVYPDTVFIPKRRCGNVDKPFFNQVYRNGQLERVYRVDYDRAQAMECFFAIDAAFPYPVYDKSGIYLTPFYTLCQHSNEPGKFYVLLLTHHYHQEADGMLCDSPEEVRNHLLARFPNILYRNTQTFRRIEQSRRDAVQPLLEKIRPDLGDFSAMRSLIWEAKRSAQAYERLRDILYGSVVPVSPETTIVTYTIWYADLNQHWSVYYFFDETSPCDERRDHFQSRNDALEVVRRAAGGRKVRELSYEKFSDERVIRAKQGRRDAGHD